MRRWTQALSETYLPHFPHPNMHVLLLTEDSADPRLFKESVTDLRFDYSFTACKSVAEVWAKLTSRQMPLPSLIFVDFELSKVYGHQLVQTLKQTDELKTAPVIMVGEYAEQEEIVATYLLQVSCFVVFPREPDLRRKKIKACLEFWTTYAELPQLRRWWDTA